MLAEEFVLLKLHSRNDKELAERYVVGPVPLVLLVDQNGREGFEFPPAPFETELLPLALLGKARMQNRRRQYEAMRAPLERALEVAPSTLFRAEILYYLGWSSMVTGDRERAGAVIDELKTRYKETSWGALFAGA